MKLKELLYFMKYGINSLLLRRYAPIVAGMPLTDVCNLKCRHCVVANTGRGHYPFSRIEEIMRKFYGSGARILYLQGGEITMWSDADKTLDDVIKKAREIGFFKIATVTNGTFPINMISDAVWVSMDGPKKYHDSIRGEGMFDTTMGNIRNSNHPNIAVNITVNKLNSGGVEELIKLACAEKNIKGVSVNFHTPYPGVESLAVGMEERKNVVDKVTALKRGGCRVLNTYNGLKALGSGKYKRPVHMIHLMEKGEIFECCWGKKEKGVCEKCGYGIIPELAAIESFNPAALIGAFDLFKAV